MVGEIILKYIKFILIGIVLIFLLSLLFLFNYEGIQIGRAIDSGLGDINGDGNDEFLVLTKGLFGKNGKELIIYNGIYDLTEIYREDFSELNPWKIDTGDIDGDGIDEISIGVYKKTIFHPVMANRPFIYSFKGNDLLAKWRGSRLSRPFTDYTFHDIDEDGVDEIISIEVLENEKMLINSYKWIGFGIEGFMESSEFDSITELYSGNDIFVHIENDGQIFSGKVALKEDSLVIERMD